MIEREDLISWRHRYLRKIKQYREEGRPIYYLDETWTFAGMTTPKAWVDTNIKTSKQAYLEGFGRGCLSDATGKGQRLIVLHVGSENGFLEGAGLVFRTSGKLADYHGDMNSDKFEKWFQEELLPRLPNNAVIVMDNAKYHSRELDKPPTTSSTKKVMQDWLREKGIHFEEKMTKRMLYEKIKQHKPTEKTYAVDKMASDAGFTVLRLPPYHCELNPIEMVWAQVKHFVKDKNTSKKLQLVEDLTHQALEHVTAEQWKNTANTSRKRSKKCGNLKALWTKWWTGLLYS